MDTNIVSLMGRVTPPKGLRPWLLNVGIHRLALCYPVIAELMRGAHLRAKDNPERAVQLFQWASQLQAMEFPYPEMTAEVAGIYASMTSVPSLRHMWTVQRDQKSNRLGHDLMIAAVSIVHRLPLVTANTDHFLQIHELFPLPGLYQPMKSLWSVEPPFEVPLPNFDPGNTEPDRGALPILPKAPEPTASF